MPEKNTKKCEHKRVSVFVSEETEHVGVRNERSNIVTGMKEKRYHGSKVIGLECTDCRVNLDDRGYAYDWNN
jgi:hypothetical protein